MDRFLAMQVFTRVVDASSFTRAAEALDMPRGSVTTTIQHLEAWLGVRLMNRSTRRLSLTPDGAAYYERCVRILADIEETEANFQSGSGSPRGKLRIAMPGSIGRLLVIPSLSAFHARYPDLDVQLDLTERAVDLLQEGVDCAVRVGALKDSSLVGRRLGLLDGVTCASPDYLKREGCPRALDDLAHHYCVGYCPHRGARAPSLSFLVRREEVEVKMNDSLSVNDSDAYVACGLEGFGIIQPPRVVALGHLRTGALVEVLPELRPAPAPVSIVYLRGRHLPPKVRVFVDWIADLFERCPLLNGRTGLEKTVRPATALDERERESRIETPAASELFV
ncbi:LysR family transcriptional regulator [Paraburkholderia caballeronis]|uniref:LysR family transcriptional regulator n=1 Tax=Paraburkholderia caballeronis TaxID=416943 RepID=UPI0010656175|nr:LysR family transcriptional regulator [Paraburkholderia caballeronis]TDV09458.1 LysR family transcriptional regulator for bpeEF and oprC [Paraburkholderia caballeronis]TDV13729.1 LysR family transcriptional regulator for bpeEF and oprC [Paraburkholderia caballeronis]TDV22911.1 LysR family transcriptional regulator for bpeEF and oprC [Paraburkholderia caballeronis]